MATAFGGTSTNFRLGNHRVTWNAIDLGYTVDGVAISIAEEWKDDTADQDGSTVLDSFFAGEKVTVTLKLKEFTAALLGYALPTATVTTGTKVEFGGSLAASATGVAKSAPLTLHPLDKDDLVLTADWSFFKALPKLNGDVEAKAGERMVIPVVFTCYPDAAKARGKRTFQFGS